VNARALHGGRAGQFAEHGARIFDGRGQLFGFEELAGELFAQALGDRRGQLGGCEGALEELAAHLDAQRAGFLGFAFQLGDLALHVEQRLDRFLVGFDALLDAFHTGQGLLCGRLGGEFFGFGVGHMN
jgi:hypothetical protein